jgi:serine/threonine-protein kinase
VGPTEIVSDSKKIAGTPAIVNGLSCMACHQYGMIGNLRDTVRDGASVAGEAREIVRQLYVQPEVMDRLVKKDEERFVRALEEAMGPFLKTGADKDKDIRDFPEPISALARWYLVQELGAEEAARELGLPDVKKLQVAIQANGRLEELGLGPLAQDASIKRETWETLKSFVSPFQEAARELKTGTPKRYQ